MTRSMGDATAGATLGSLLRRDPGLRGRSWAKAIVLGFLIANMYGILTGIRVYRYGSVTLAGGSLHLLLIAGLSWLLLGAMLMIVRGNLRGSPFDLTLPIPAPALARARCLATLIIGTIMLAVMLGVALALGRVRGLPHGPVEPVLLMTLHLWSVFLLALGSLQNLRPGLAEVAWDRRTRRPLTALLAGTLVLLLALLRWLPAWGWILPLLAGLLLLLRAHRRLPRAFLVAPLEPDPEGVRATSEATAAWRGSGMRWVLARILFPTTLKHAWVTVTVPVVVFYGIMLGRHSSASFGITQIPWIWIMLILILAVPMGSLHMLDALPLSRRRILPWLLLPGMVVTVIALLVTRGIGDQRAEARGLLRLVADSEVAASGADDEADGDEADSSLAPCRLLVPASLHEIAWDGVAPELAGPGVERHTPSIIRPIAGLPPVIFSPFDTPPGASPDFVAGQLKRAIEAAYGRDIPAAELEARYLRPLPGGGTGVRPEGLTLLADYPDLRARPRRHDLPLLLAALVVPWFFIVGWGLRLFTRFARESTRRVVFPLFALVPLAISIVFILAAESNWIEPDWVYAGYRICARTITAALPGGSLLLWGLLALGVAVGYRFAESRFRRVESMRPE